MPDALINLRSRTPEPPRAGGAPNAAWRRARSETAVILAIGTCVITLLWMIMIVEIHSDRRAAIQHASSEANNLSAAFQGEVGQTLRSVARAIDAVAVRMRAAPGRFDIHEWAREIPLLADAMVQGAIAGPNGDLLSTTLDADLKGINVADREHFRVHLDAGFHGLFISKPVVGRVSGLTTIQVSKRVDADDGTFLGVIVFGLAPGQLTTLHQAIDLGPRGHLLVVGTGDNVVRARFGAGLRFGEHHADSDAGPEVGPPPPNPVTADAPVQTFIRANLSDHIERLHSVRPVRLGFPLRVGVALDMAEILRPAADQERLILAIGVLATLMLSGLTLLLAFEIHRRTDREVKLRDEQARLATEIEQGRRIQERLRASEMRLRDFAEMASDWFWEQDAELRFTPINPEALPVAADAELLFGKCRWEVNDTSQEPDKWANHKRDLVARKPFRDFRFARTYTDGTVQHVSVNGVPVFDQAGGFLGYRGTGRDITAKVLADAELRQSKELAEASDRAKSAFLANMSHELRTPLNAIIGFAELIHARKAGRITGELVEWAGDILASGRHLLDLINNVLELSRIESGRFDLVDDTVDLRVVVRGCVPMVRRQAEQTLVRIECQIAERAALLLGDRRAIKQVVLNLLTNAVKFTQGGGVVTIRTELTAAGELCLAVADTGIGIDPDALPRLCQPFIQAEASTNRRYGGTGLGLAISDRLVGLHGGTLTVTSALGEGTTVWVRFPSARVLAVRPDAAAAE